MGSPSLNTPAAYRPKLVTAGSDVSVCLSKRPLECAKTCKGVQRCVRVHARWCAKVCKGVARWDAQT